MLHSAASQPRCPCRLRKCSSQIGSTNGYSQDQRSAWSEYSVAFSRTKHRVAMGVGSNGKGSSIQILSESVSQSRGGGSAPACSLWFTRSSEVWLVNSHGYFKYKPSLPRRAIWARAGVTSEFVVLLVLCCGQDHIVLKKRCWGHCRRVFSGFQHDAEYEFDATVCFWKDDTAACFAALCRGDRALAVTVPCESVCQPLWCCARRVPRPLFVGVYQREVFVLYQLLCCCARRVPRLLCVSGVDQHEVFVQLQLFVVEHDELDSRIGSDCRSAGPCLLQSLSRRPCRSTVVPTSLSE